MNTLTLDMLSTGMRVIHNNGIVGIILKDIDCIITQHHGFTLLCEVLGITAKDPNDNWAIKEVYFGYRRDLVLSFDDLNNMIWVREGLTQEQKQILELEETILKAQQQIQQLKEKI